MAAGALFSWLLFGLIPPALSLFTLPSPRSWCKAQYRSRYPPKERPALRLMCLVTACSTGWARSWAWTRCEGRAAGLLVQLSERDLMINLIQTVLCNQV